MNTWDPFDSIPDQVGGRYTLLEQIGVGGAGVVHRALDTQKQTHVAVKLLEAPMLTEPSRFKAEARAMHRLSHPRLVPVQTAGKQGRYYWYVMPLMGASLQRRVKETGPLTPVEALCSIHQIAGALHYIHHQRLIHRDVKPANVLYDSEGMANLADFGIAKFLNADDSSAHTRHGEILGSPNYRAPEQSIDASTATLTADIYGLAATLFFALTAKKPPLLYAMQPEHREERLVFVPEPLRPLILESLDRDPSKRPQSAKDFALRLRTHASEMTLADGPAPMKWVGSFEDPKQSKSWWDWILRR